MKFQKVGKAYQLVINNGQDLQDALTLDEALWVAMSAPVKAYTCDPKVLTYIDTLKLGSITTEALKGAIRWLLDVYADKDSITEHFDGKLELSKLTSSDTAKEIAHSAEYILNDLNVEDKSSITLAQVREFQKILTSRPLNGDGVFSLLATGEASTDALKKEIHDIVEDTVIATGGKQDLDGTVGATLEQIKTFLAAIPEFLEWRKAGLLPEGQNSSDILPFGQDTAAVLDLLKANAGLVDEFFKLCDLQGFDTRFHGQVLQNDGKPGTLDPTAWPGVEEHLKAMPIVQPNGKAAILLDAPEYINPLYRGWWADLTAKLLRPLLGTDLKELTPADWAKVKAFFGAYEAYMGSQKGGICAGVDVAHLEHYLTLTGVIEEATDLETKDLAVAQILKEAGAVEQALLYLQWLVKIANNFISFPSLYEPKTPTLFERGRVVIDGRWFNITFPVDDMGAHSALATHSGLFLIYVDVDTKPAQVLCAPVTIGDKGNLVAGKRGIFFSPDGQTYNAKIAKVIENPVCLKEAVFAPFAKFGKMAEDKVASMSSTSEGAITGKMSSFINDPKATAAAATAAPPAQAPAKDKSGMLMGLGIAFAALSSALAFICKTLSSMSGVAILISVLCVLAVLIMPIILLAVLRLRRQDLSSLLEGNGWAINARMRLTGKQRRTFSRGGRFPNEAEGTPKKRLAAGICYVLLVLAIILAGYFGWRYHVSCQQAAELEQAQMAESVNPAPAETEAPVAEESAPEAAPAPEAPAPEAAPEAE